MNDFENRFRKNLKHIQKWAKRQKISCYRIYDFDLPNFPLSIDIYGQYVHVSEYRTKHQLEGIEHAQWLSGIREVIAQVCDISLDRMIPFLIGLYGVDLFGTTFLARITAADKDQED